MLMYIVIILDRIIKRIIQFLRVHNGDLKLGHAYLPPGHGGMAQPLIMDFFYIRN